LGEAMMSIRFRRSANSFVCFGLLVALGGCASNTTNSGFDQVQRDVADWSGQQIYWDTSSQDDARANVAVDRLLQHDLTADTAVETALLNNRELQATFEEMGIAQADLVRAGLLKNPVFNGAYEFASGGGLAKVNLSVTEDFLSILQIPLRKRAAGAALEAARLRAADAVINLTAQVRTAFYEYVSAEQILAVEKESASAMKVSADAADRFRQAGNITDLDLANEQVMEEKASMESTSAEADAAERRENLNELMGLAGDRSDAWKSAAGLPAVPPTQPAAKEMERIALDRRLDLAAAKREAEEAAGELGIAKQFALLSDASAGASAEREHEGFWETGPAVSVPIPLFDLGGASVAGARARMRQSQRRYQAMAVQVQAEVRRAENRMNAAVEQVRCYQQTMLPLRQRIIDQTMLRYQGMLASVFQLLSAKDAQLETETDSIKATRDYWIADAELQRAVGGKIP
jgi:cobalt-zinc-cadmium efflux system outer membrane protein